MVQGHKYVFTNKPSSTHCYPEKGQEKKLRQSQKACCCCHSQCTALAHDGQSAGQPKLSQYLGILEWIKDVDAKKKSVFYADSGIYRIKVLLFGFKFVGIIFQILISQVLDRLYNFTCACTVSSTIYNSSWEEQRSHLVDVPERRGGRFITQHA